MYRSLVVMVLLVLAGCGGEAAPVPSSSANAPSVDDAQPLAGVPDRGNDPAVVALVQAGGNACAGALLAADVVLTAGRCVPASLQGLRVFAGENPSDAVERARGAQLLVAPATDADVALVRIDATIDDVVPLAVRATGIAKGDHVRTVGFAPRGKIVRDHAPVLGSGDRAFDVGEESCKAVSGGLALDESSGEIVGVLTGGAPDCVPGAGRDVYARADGALASFAKMLSAGRPSASHGAAKTKKGPVDMGAGCARGAECAAGACVSYGGAEYCSRACDAHDACPTRFKCMNTQQTVTVCVER